MTIPIINIVRYCLMRFVIAFSFCVLFSSTSTAQVYDGTVAGADLHEIGYDFISHNDGSYTILASTRSVADEAEDFALIQITALKHFVWIDVIGGRHHDYPYSLIETSDGGYLMCGSKWDGGFQRMDAYLMKLDENFNFQWNKYFGGFHHDLGFNVIECSAGGYALSGFTRSFEPGEVGDFYVVRTDANGIMQWEYVSGTTNSKDYVFDLAEDNSGNLIACGVESGHFLYSTFDFSTSHSKSTLLKINPLGNLVWQKSFDGAQNCWYQEIEMLSDNSFYTVGSSQNNSFGSFDMTLTKFNPQGDSLWQLNYGGTSFDYGKSLVYSSDNFIYLAGATCNDTVNFSTDIYVVKTDTSGNVIWDNTFGGPKNELSYKIKETIQGVTIVGSTESYGNGESDVYLIELDKDGNILHQGSDAPVLDVQIYLYPNPADDALNILIDTDLECESFQMQFMDSQGKLIAERQIINQQFNLVDVSNWSIGMYYYRLNSECFDSEFGKIIIR